MVDHLCIYSISDLHFNRLSEKNFDQLFTYWPRPKSVVVIPGDVADHRPLKDYPFSETHNIIFPGNHDPGQSQEVSVHKLGLIAVVGGLGFNYKMTPWAASHLHDLHSEPDPFCSNLHKALLQVENYEDVIVALHLPPFYKKGNMTIVEENFLHTISQFDNIFCILYGHIHNNPRFQHPDSLVDLKGRIIPLYNVSAFELGYRPICIWKKPIKNKK